MRNRQKYVFYGTLIIAFLLLLSACSAGNNPDHTTESTSTTQATTDSTTESPDVTEPSSTTQTTTQVTTQATTESPNSRYWIQDANGEKQSLDMLLMGAAYKSITEEIEDIYKGSRQTGISIDLDGDGEEDKIYEAGFFFINDKMQIILEHDEWWILDIDRTDDFHEILIRVGEGHTSRAKLYRYDQYTKDLVEIGEYWYWGKDDIHDISNFVRINDRVIEFWDRPGTMINNTFIMLQYYFDTTRLNENLTIVPGVYGLENEQTENLLVELEVYEKPDLRSATRKVLPQGAKLIYTDGVAWTYVEFADGTSGYVYYDGKRDDLNGGHRRGVFDGYNGAG